MAISGSCLKQVPERGSWKGGMAHFASLARFARLRMGRRQPTVSAAAAPPSCGGKGGGYGVRD